MPTPSAAGQVSAAAFHVHDGRVAGHEGFDLLRGHVREFVRVQVEIFALGHLEDAVVAHEAVVDEVLDELFALLLGEKLYGA